MEKSGRVLEELTLALTRPGYFSWKEAGEGNFWEQGGGGALSLRTRRPSSKKGRRISPSDEFFCGKGGLPAEKKRPLRGGGAAVPSARRLIFELKKSNHQKRKGKIE